MLPRLRLHQTTFILAGLYNIAWAIANPQWLFRYADTPLQNYPEIFACLAMVIGLYGLLYLYVAINPVRA